MDLAAQREARSEWETRIASLTQSVRDIEVRGESLVWEGPPKSLGARNNTGAGPSDGAARPWIGVVDNPPINPVDVLRGNQYTKSVTAWQNNTRAEAARGVCASHAVWPREYFRSEQQSNLS